MPALSRGKPFRVTRLKIIFTIHIYIHYQNPKKKIKKKSTIGDHTPKTICFLFKYSSSLIIPVSCEVVIFPAIRAESPKTIVSPKVPGPRIPLAYRMEEGKREVRQSDVESRMTPMMTDRKTWQAIALGSATVGGPRRRRSSSGKLVAIVRTVLTMAMPMVALRSRELS